MSEIGRQVQVYLSSIFRHFECVDDPPPPRTWRVGVFYFFLNASFDQSRIGSVLACCNRAANEIW